VVQRVVSTAMRNFVLPVVCLCAAAPLAAGQATLAAGGSSQDAAAAAFEVVSVKPVPPGARISMMGMRSTLDGIQCESITLTMLVRAAYGGFMKLPSGDSVAGLPDWAKTGSYSINAKMSEAQGAEFKGLSKDEQEQRREAMLQSLLADRFQMKAHRESKQVPDFDLVVAKSGAKLQASDTSTDGVKDRDGKPVVGSYLRMSGMGKVTAQALSIDQLANFLTQPMMGLGRPVKDKTGLAGKYNFSLNWTPDQGLGSGPMGGAPPPPPPPSGVEPGPSIFTALQEQLGLKLQPSTGTFDVVVVDHVERPSEN
jgi:uncharacterized protein (TIGR03435 family)